MQKPHYISPAREFFYQQRSTLYTKSRKYWGENVVSFIRPDVAMTNAEIREIVKAAEKRKAIGSKSGIKSWFYTKIGLNTGFRASEIAGLTMGSLVLDDPIPHIFILRGKTYSSARVAIINSGLAKDIFEYIGYKREWGEAWNHKKEPLLRSPITGKSHYSRYGVYDMFKDQVLPLAENIAYPDRFTSHCLRHSFSRMVGDITSEIETSNPDYEMIRDLLGHYSIETTKIYMRRLSFKKIYVLEELSEIVNTKKNLEKSKHKALF